MRIGKQDTNKIIVSVKTVKRGTEGKQKGKMVYESIETIDVYDATPEQVVAACMRGLQSAENSTKK